MPFIPTQEVLIGLIKKATQLKNETDVIMTVNPKERKRKVDEQDLDEPIYPPYCELRVLP